MKKPSSWKVGNTVYFYNHRARQVYKGTIIQDFVLSQCVVSCSTGYSHYVSEHAMFKSRKSAIKYAIESCLDEIETHRFAINTLESAITRLEGGSPVV